MIKRIHFFSALCILFAISVNPAFAAKPQTLDGIVAVVNDSVITQSELNQMIQTISKQMQSSNVSLPPYKVLKKQVLDQLINKKLQTQLAEQMGIKIKDADVDKAIGMIAANNKVPVNILYEKVVESGMSTQEYKKMIREELMFQQVQQMHVGSKITITPQEVDDYMHSKTWDAYNSKEYHLQDILIALPEKPSAVEIENARKKADALLARIRGGLSFKEAATSAPGDSNALQGGDLGWRKLPEVPSAFAGELIHLKANDLMGPIQTPNGFHILKLEGIRTIASKKNAGKDREQIQQLIYQRKFEQSLQNWFTKLRSDAFVNINET